MDLALTPEEEAFGEEARRWLQANVEVPAGFRSLDEEFEWGRRWQARLAADRWNCLPGSGTCRHRSGF